MTEQEVTIVRNSQGMNKQLKQRYVTGSNAVAYDYAPQSKEQAVETKRSTQSSKATRNSINPFYTLLLVSLVFLMLIICVMMLKAQFTVANTSEQVIKLKHELTNVRRGNAHLESIVHEQLDLVEIKRIAMEEYGMVFPSETDVIRITPEASSYTVQFTDVTAPAKERASIGNVLAFITRGW